MTGQTRDEKAIFLAALEKGTPQERSAFLEEACAGDPALLDRVKELLATHEQSRGPLDSPPPGISAYPSIDPPVTETPGTQIGPYKLLQQIGEGGMGVVYMAEQSEPVERRVALKIIKPGMDSRQVIARFEAEKQALAMMDHPNIAKVFDAGTTEPPLSPGGRGAGGEGSGRPYFVMELVKGVPITQYCDEHHLTPQQRLELFVPVCHAVQHAHQKGIIHRDLKPTNVLVAEYDDRPVPKIIDFGVAKAIDQRLAERTMFTALGQVVGTIDYMSPEQTKLNQLDIDTRTDIYSLGVLLYELLTGETPLDRQRLRSAAFDEMLRIIREEEPPKPSLRLSSSDSLPSIAANRQIEPKKLSTLVRGELDWIVMKALEKDRTRRYETANGFAADIERYLSDEPVLACPPSAGYRLRKFARRNKGPVLAVSLLLLALVGGIIGTTWGLVCAEKARRDAVAAQLAEAERAEGERRARDEAQKAFEAERKAKEGENTQRLRAEENVNLAIAILDEIFIKEVGQRLALSIQDEAKGLAKNPEREKSEREFLEKGLKFYERLAETNATDWSARRSRAKAYAKVGLVERRLKDFTASEKAYRQAVHLMEELAEERPKDFDNRFDLAYTYHWLSGPYLESGRVQPAEEATRHALALFEKLAADFPEHRSQWEGYGASCQRTLAEVLQKAGKLPEAEKAYRAALTYWENRTAETPAVVVAYRWLVSATYEGLFHTLLEQGKHREAAEITEKLQKLAVAHPDVPELWLVLARNHCYHAQVLANSGQVDEAEKAYRQALPIWEKLGTDLPDRQEYRQHASDTRIDMAHLDWKRGERLKGAGKPKEAEECYRRALGLIEKSVADCPGERFYRKEQAYTYWLLGGLLKDTGRAQQAENAYRQAVAIGEKLVADFPDKGRLYSGRLSAQLAELAENLLQQGKHTEAARVAEKMPSVIPEDANGYRRAADFFSRCVPLAEKDAKLSETERRTAAKAYADRSRALLEISQKPPAGKEKTEKAP